MSDNNFDRIESLLAELDVDDLDLVAPPTGLWGAIEHQLAAEPTATVTAITATAARRRSVATWVMAAAAAAALIVAGTLVVVGRGTDAPVLAATVLTFDADAFDPRGADASARAKLVNRDGSYTIQLTNTEFPQLDGDDLELWLIQPDESGTPLDVAPVSLIDPDGDGVYDVPAGLDPTTHFVVDISIEPRDGVEAHSGQSILRGSLEQS